MTVHWHPFPEELPPPSYSLWCAWIQLVTVSMGPGRRRQLRVAYYNTPRGEWHFLPPHPDNGSKPPRVVAWATLPEAYKGPL